MHKIFVFFETDLCLKVFLGATVTQTDALIIGYFEWTVLMMKNISFFYFW